MYQYPNYMMNNNIQYQQQMYQPVQNPYIDRMQQLQSYQQQMIPQQTQNIPQVLNARIVDNFEMITANDVPMNGGSLFVKADGSEIQYRQWTAQGTINTTRFSPEIATSDKDVNVLSTEDRKTEFDRFYNAVQGVSDKIDKIESRLDEALKTKNPKRKVEVTADDEY